MDPDMRTFTITMPAVGVFLLGTAVCCYCCFRYGLQRWYERTLEKTRTQSRIGITYAASLQYKKEQLEHALRKVTKLRKDEPARSDLKYEAVALKEGIRMMHEHLRNSERYADYCSEQKRPTEALNMQQQQPPHGPMDGNSFVNPMFDSISSTTMIDPGTRSSEAAISPASSDSECHNPKHRELELYLMSTGGAILPSMLAYPGTPASPLQRRQDGEGGDLNASSPAPPDSPPPPSPESPPRMPPNWQQRSPILNNTLSPRNSRLEV